MAFMQHEVTGKEHWFAVGTDHGRVFIPFELIGHLDDLTDEEGELTEQAREAVLPYVESHQATFVHTVELISGYGARTSAPGYLDCTDWTVFDTPAEAKAYLDEWWAVDDDDEAEGEA